MMLLYDGVTSEIKQVMLISRLIVIIIISLKTNEELSMSEGVGTYWCVNISSEMISDDSIRKITRYLIFSKDKYLMRSITGVKINVKIEIV